MLKKNIYLLLILLLYNNAYAQRYSINFLPYNNSDVGSYGVISFSKALKNNYVASLGLTYHYNDARAFEMKFDTRYYTEKDRNTDRYLHKRFKALKVSERFGLVANLQKNVKLFRSEYLTPYVFAEITGRNMSTVSHHRDSAYMINDTAGNYVYPYKVVRDYFVTIPDLWSFDCIAGVGLNVKMFGKCYFTTNFGIGTNFIFNVPTYVATNGIVAEYSFKKNVGVTLKL